MPVVRFASAFLLYVLASLSASAQAQTWSAPPRTEAWSAPPKTQTWSAPPKTEVWSAPPAPAPRAPAPNAAATASPEAAGAWQAGDDVWVTWTGTSHKARILQARGGQYLVRYEGYDSKWDEWVGPGRIRGKVESRAAPVTGTGAQGAQQGQRQAGSRSPLGPWECATWDAGQLNRIGGFTLAAGGTYTDLNSGQQGRYSFQEATGRIAFTSGPQKVDAPVTFDPEGRQGLGHIVIHYTGDARLDCYRASR